MTALVGLDKRAMERGFAAWRADHGFGTHFPRWANPAVGSPATIAAVISPDLRTAPFTCFDPQHADRWPAPHPRIVAYVRAVENPSLRDLMALYAVIKAGLGDVTFYTRLCAFAVPLRKLLAEEQIAVVQSIDPDDLLFRVFDRRAGLTLSDSQRSWILLVHYEGVYATSLFAHLVVRMQTITGARIGEVQQIAQTPHCITQLVNVGPKSATRWILRMAPKGRKERADYFIDPDTKDLLVEVVRFLRARLQLKKRPIVSHQSPKYGPDRYLLQWSGKALDCAALNTAVRFLLHGVVLTPEGQGHPSHHAPASARICHRNGKSAYPGRYRRPAPSSTPCRGHAVLCAPHQTAGGRGREFLFVDRIDVADEAVRHPEEIGKLLRDAEGQIGALSEVLGGCVVGNMCPAKFACIGVRGECTRSEPTRSRRPQAAVGRTADLLDDQGRLVCRATADDTTGARL